MAVTGRNKGHKVFGRRLKGAAKKGRSGPVPSKHKRKVWGETPEDRCSCHHMWPCSQAGKKA